jgi:hypothetical protein
MGIVTGVLWAAWAGLILALILTGAALGGASAHTPYFWLAMQQVRDFTLLPCWRAVVFSPQ